MLGLPTKDSQANTAASGKIRRACDVSAKDLADVTRDFALHHVKLRKLEQEAARFCAAMAGSETPGYWLSLLGPSGTGKTMIAKRILRFFRAHIEGAIDENRGRPGVDSFRRTGGLLEWPRMVERMTEGDFGFTRQAMDDWLVCIDDIGSEYGKLRDLAIAKLFAILNARQGKFTILTANLGVEQIGELDTRIASRLLRHGGVVIDTTGVPDFALRK